MDALKPNKVPYQPCPKCGVHRTMPGSSACKRCRYAQRKKELDRARSKVRHAVVSCGCGMPLEGNRICPACAYGAQMSWSVLAEVYSARNPDDPIDAAQAKKAFHTAVAKLRRAMEDPDSDAGRLLNLAANEVDFPCSPFRGGKQCA